MKLLFSSIIIFINVSLVDGQIDTMGLNLLHQKIRSLQPAGTIYYADKPNKQVLQRQYQNLDLRKFKNFRQNTTDSVLILTKSEQQYLISELKKLLESPLPDSLFQNSKCVSSDSVVPFVEQLNLRMYGSIRHLSDSSQARKAWKKPMKYWSFIFTPAIYIRSKTIFLQYFMYYSLSSGANYLAFYKKISGKWNRWITVSGGAW